MHGSHGQAQIHDVNDAKIGDRLRSLRNKEQQWVRKGAGTARAIDLNICRDVILYEGAVRQAAVHA